MNTPKVQTDNVPTEGAPSDHNPDGTTPHGIPDALRGQDASGRASNARIETETAPLASEEGKA